MSTKPLRTTLARPYLIALSTFLLTMIAAIFGLGYAASELRWWWEILLAAGLLLFATITALVTLLVATELNFEKFLTEACKALGLLRPETNISTLRGALMGIGPILFKSIVVGLVLIINLSSLAVPGWNLIVLLITAFILAVDFYAAPSQAHGIGITRQMRIMLKDIIYTFVFGLVMAAYVSVPFLGIIFIPCGYMIAMERLDSITMAGK